jgi:hypothetical protein
MDRQRCHHSGRHRPRVLAPPQEPEIVYGAFVGRKLSELSDEDLNRFLSSDAKVQFKLATPTPLFKAGSYLDLSSYWFAKYELERRKHGNDAEDQCCEGTCPQPPEKIGAKRRNACTPGSTRLRAFSTSI